MNVTLPNGTVINDVPDGTTKAQIMQKAISSGLATQADFQSAQSTPVQSPAQPIRPFGPAASTSNSVTENGGWVSAYNAQGQVIAAARSGTSQADALQQEAANQQQTASTTSQSTEQSPNNGLPDGMIQAGNIDIHNRPIVKNPDGSISTVRSMSIGVGPNKEVLIPTVSDDGRIMSDKEAIDTYSKTGRNLGTFTSPDAATAYAQSLHNEQAQEYLPKAAAQQQAVQSQQQPQPTQSQPAAQPQQQAVAQQPTSTPIGGSTPQNTDSILSQTVQGIDEAGKALAQSAVNVANIIPEVGDAAVSAGTWAANKVGIGNGTYTPATRFSLPSQLQPQTTAGQTAASIIPYLVPGVAPERAAEASAIAGNAIARGTTGAVRMAADTAPGALAQNSQQDNPQNVATDLAAGVVGGAAMKGVSTVLAPIVGRVAQIIGNQLPGAAERAAVLPEARINPGVTPQQAVEQASPGVIPASQSTPSAAELGNLAQTANRATNTGAPAAAQQQFAQQVIPDQDVLAAARKLGLEESLTPGMYSQNPAYRAFEIANATTPGTKMFQAHREAIGRLGTEADKFINDFGGSTDKSFVNHQVRSEYSRLINGLKTQSNKIYDRISAAVPKPTIVNPEKTINMIEDVADDVGGLNALKNTYPVLSKTLNQLQSADSGSMHAAGETTPVTYGRLDAIRQQVGKALGSKINQGPFGDVDKNTLGKLYDALTDDQGAVVKTAGLDKEWSAAKEMVNLRKQVESVSVKNLGKGLNGDIIPPIQKAITDMAQGGGKNFRSLVNDLPDTLKETVVLTAMNKAFTSFAKSPGQQLGISGFVKWYNGMMRNKENIQALSNAIGYPATRRLHNIYVVANGMQRIGSEKVYSKTQIDRMLANFDKDSGMLSKIYGIGRKAARAEGITSALHLPGLGTAHAIISALNAPPVNRTVAADELMASPRFKDMTKKMFDPFPVRDAAERAFENSRVYKSWLATVEPGERSALLRRGMIGFLVSPEVAGSQDNLANGTYQ